MKLKNWKTENRKKLGNRIRGVILASALMLALAGCAGEDVKTDEGAEVTEVGTEVVNVTTLGEGESNFYFTVVDGEGNRTDFEIHTDQETVGEALLEVDLIVGQEGQYGLYVKEVNGIEADYDKNQTYWAFYVDGEYAVSGVDTTAVEEGRHYEFRVEK